MWGSVTVKEKPQSLPLSVADLRARLRIDETGDQSFDNVETAMLEGFIASGVAMIDGPSGIGFAMMRQIWTLTLDCFSPVIRLPGAPISGVSEIRYMAASGDMRVVPSSQYRLANGCSVARLVPTMGHVWPSCPAGPGVIEIDFELGCENASDVPPDLITAIALNAGHLYENREAVTQSGTQSEIPLGVSAILGRYRRGFVGA
jgi:uncharacterized phiE125 gp8 family phage protein